ncbi:Mur ligase family protein [Synechococcus sp. CCY9201]|uniref:Mur ligase family protein n=1 Tax=Synechococcus sp. CCY9201 TaxID=174697 RepID=UPI002B2171D5|nr:Mur ligase family protein [Synechococcus sp. CCY9201]MEA5474013.1 Mur ligase family protein [Synechococcus sp. CCY9201]
MSAEHMRRHRSLSGLIRHKAAVVSHMRSQGTVLLPADGPHASRLQQEVQRHNPGRILSFGLMEGADARVIHVTGVENGQRVKARILGETTDYVVPMLEVHAPAMSAGVLLAAKVLGYSLKDCSELYSSARNYQTSGKLYRIRKHSMTFHLYDQTHRGYFEGFLSTCQLAAQLPPDMTRRKIAVLTELYNLDDNVGHRYDLNRAARLLKKAGLDRIYTTHRFAEHAGILPDGVTWVAIEKLDQLTATLRHTLQDGDFLLLHGVWKANLSTITEQLLQWSEGYECLY